MLKKIVVIAVACGMFCNQTLNAHRQWMLPSQTVLSKTDSWITIDAAVSNELFYFDHVPMRLAGIQITAPNGSKIQPQNVSTGKYRSTFDLHLTMPGTYRIASVSNTVFATWTENGAVKNWRGDASKMAQEVPAGSSDLKVSKMSGRVEVFATVGKPDLKALQPSGSGLEMVPVTHPNDLVAGEKATFQFLHNGKPASDLEVTLIPGGIRYRDQLKEQKIRTDAQGKATVTFSEPGMYWLSASIGDGRPGGPPPQANAAANTVASKPAPSAANPGPRPMPGDRANYVATLEVLPQ
jgi:uncharacterized GH25 family protein